MKPFIAALRFLTILPLPAGGDGEETHLGKSLSAFPVVGLLIGLAAAGLDATLIRVFPPLVAAALLVIALIAVSGGLHLDGLADTADGFFSSRPRERILEIMRDSRTGPMGVAALVCVVSLKIAAVASIGAQARWAAIVMMPLAGRCALVILLALLPYARSEGGLATIFHENRSKFLAVWAVAILALVGWLWAGPAGLVMAAVAVAGMLAFAALTHAKIGGLTGDTLGAACEIIELLPALVAAAATYRL
jgi:adenosylcobinamide-GDP ribazoletransferase